MFAHGARALAVRAAWADPVLFTYFLLLLHGECLWTAEHHAGWLYILTNALPRAGSAGDALRIATEPQPKPSEGRTVGIGRELQLVAAPAAHPGLENWQSVIEARPEVVLCDMDMLRWACRQA